MCVYVYDVYDAYDVYDVHDVHDVHVHVHVHVHVYVYVENWDFDGILDAKHLQRLKHHLKSLWGSGEDGGCWMTLGNFFGTHGEHSQLWKLIRRQPQIWGCLKKGSPQFPKILWFIIISPHFSH